MSQVRFDTAYSVESHAPTAPGWPHVVRRHTIVLDEGLARRWLEHVRKLVPSEHWSGVITVPVLTDGVRYCEIGSMPRGMFDPQEPPT